MPFNYYKKNLIAYQGSTESSSSPDDNSGISHSTSSLSLSLSSSSLSLSSSSLSILLLQVSQLEPAWNQVSEKGSPKWQQKLSPVFSSPFCCAQACQVFSSDEIALSCPLRCLSHDAYNQYHSACIFFFCKFQCLLQDQIALVRKWH